MKYVLNKAYGGFSIPDCLCEALNCHCYDDSDYLRTNPLLIDYVEAHPKSDLDVVEIPDNATDWIVNEYDGYETVYYVVNGKIRTT